MPVNEEGFKGGDRTSIDLPKPEEELLEAVTATGKPVVLVLANGSALAVNWANEHVNAILESWYAGEEGGAAIAETLSGKNDPAGRLPVTFYTGMISCRSSKTIRCRTAPIATSAASRFIRLAMA
jgi:beta-glucosidase